MIRGLGRRVAKDERDQRHLMRALLPDVAPTKTERFYRSGPVLDQGATSSCVGHAWRAWLSAAPVMTRTGPDAFTIYRWAQSLDEWPGAEPDYEGTSVRAGVKALAATGHISRYVWAFSPVNIARWLLSDQGTVVLGTDWYAGMTYPDDVGVMHLTGALQGGHAYLCVGYSTKRGAFRIQNSWGLGWGDRRTGRAWLLGEDMERLLAAQGEACTAIEQRVVV